MIAITPPRSNRHAKLTVIAGGAQPVVDAAFNLRVRWSHRPTTRAIFMKMDLYTTDVAQWLRPACL
ncbi:MAG: hypothetical protein L0Z50_32495 [Verrucomicrobiales bacterium]|nr:hypothetical protein [Verrucomicrobiales bacterium]